MIREWNRLPTQTKESVTIGAYKRALRSQMFPTKQKHLCQFKGKSAINQTRMRLGLSALKQQLHTYHIIESPTCEICGIEKETTIHYLLRCTRHTAARHIMFLRLGSLVAELGIDINNTNEGILTRLLLSGSIELNFEDNVNLLKIVQDYITATKRF